MKKLLSVLLIVFMLSALIACNPDGGNPINNGNPSNSSTTSAAGDSSETGTASKSAAGSDATTVVKPDTELEKSEKPNITLNMYNENKRLLVGGKCAVGAQIFIRGGISDKIYGTKDGNFMGTAELPDSGSIIVTVTQKEPGKSESDPITITAQARTDVKLNQIKGAYHEIIGDNYRGYVIDEVADYTGTNLFTDAQKTSVKDRITSNLEYLKSINPKAEIIYLLVPTQMHVYPESVPKDYVQYTADSRTAQFTEIARAAGATVIDLYNAFYDLRDNGKYNLYHNTDTHWTYYGAYIGYREVMNYISEKWPDAAPRDESEYGFYNKEIDCGDLGEHLMIDNSLLKETTTFYAPKFNIVINPDIYKPNRCELYHDNTTKEQKITGNRTGVTLPRAIIIRDSYGTPAFGIFSDAFAEAYWRAMWDYSFNKNVISSFKPDYIIYLVTERNIKSII